MSDKTTSNLGFAAYLMIKGFELIRPPNKDVNSKFVFQFNLPNEQANDLYYEYLNSDFQKFDNNLVSLKRMLQVKL